MAINLGSFSYVAISSQAVFHFQMKCSNEHGDPGAKPGTVTITWGSSDSDSDMKAVLTALMSPRNKHNFIRKLSKLQNENLLLS